MYKHASESLWGHLGRVAIAQVKLYRNRFSDKSCLDLVELL